MKKYNTYCFIDGFNLYHAIDATDANGNKPYNKFKWLNYRKLAEQFCGNKNKLIKIYYFTAIVPKNFSKDAERKRKYHENFIKIQESLGIEVVKGYFRPVKKKCSACHQVYDTFEEKRTDVNIASAIIEHAVLGNYENAIIISADSDLIPALETAKKLARHDNRKLYFRVVIPIGRTGEALSHSDATDACWQMKKKHIAKCRLEETFILPNNKEIACPTKWRK